MRHRTGLTGTACAALLATAAPCGASAQIALDPQSTKPADELTDASSSADTGDIVVTAQKREQSLSTVAASVQALSDATLENRRLRNLEDYTRFIPSLSFSGTSGAGNRNIVLRGIAPSGGGDPTVITYLDDTLIPNSLDPQLYDIARVEVLKGPQGDLYGASSAGGLIRYITPTPEFDRVSGRAEASGSATAHGQANYGAAGAINLPLTGSVALRASGVYDRRGGFVDNLLPQTGAIQRDVNGQRAFTGRATLAIKPTDRLDVALSGLYVNRKIDGFSDSDRNIFLPGGSPRTRTTSRFQDEYINTEAYVLNGTVNYDLGVGTITSSTGYVNQRQNLAIDDTSIYFVDPAIFGFSYPGFGPPFASNPNATAITPVVRRRRDWQLTQEARFASDWDFPIQALAGLYYVEGRQRENLFSGFYRPVPAYISGLYGPSANPNTLNELNYDDTTKFEEWAGFGNLSYKFAGDRGELKVGIRHFDRTSHRTIVDAPGALYLQAQDGRVSNKGELYSATGSFQATRGVFVYARYSEGFRPGQARAVPGQLCDVDFQRLGLDRSSLAPFTEPETLKNFEGGVRVSSADRKFDASLTGFHIKYSGIQQAVALPTCGNFFLLNVGAAHSNGFELSMAARPIAGMSVNADVGYTDARFDVGNTTGGIDKGEQLQFVPAWTIAVRGDYVFPIRGDLHGVLRGDITYTDRRQTVFGGVGAGPTRPTSLPDYTLVGLQAGVSTDRWEFVLTATNLFDVVPVYNSSIERYSTVGLDGRTYSIGQPRTIGARVSYKF